ncbi:restriction endonuclease subunit S [Vibrio diabolicus]|uniref:restriction endonuclease subunit S n=1 Tax=Vibrio diabolicus TaxID=50719 RepID=UPI0024945E3A|nr:restriction endonuclease subunit S [Vibrio diabolicus]
MNNLKIPNSWVRCEIESILGTQSDGKLIHQGWSPQCEKQPAETGEWGVLKTTAIQDGYFLEEENKRLPDDKEPKSRIEVKAGDLLVTNAGPRARCGVICYVQNTRTKLMISGKMYRLRFPEGLVYPQYIELWLRTSFAQKALNEIKTGISESGLNMTQARFKTLPIVLASFAEQKVITDKLAPIFDQIVATKTRLELTLETLKKFRSSVLSDAMSGSLTKDWRDKHTPATTNQTVLADIEKKRQQAWEFENIRLGKSRRYKKVANDLSKAPNVLPESWQWVSVEQLSEKVTDGVHKKPIYRSSGVPFVTVKNLTKGRGISFDELNYISQEDHEEYCKRTNPEYGDILISKDGTLGVVRRVETEAEFSIFVSVALVKPVCKKMSEYLELAFQSDVVQSQMVGVGTGLQHIHLTDLRKDLIPIPTSAEQVEIVRRVKQLFVCADATEQQVNQALDRVNNLTQSILAKAFRGELTEQWRKDNPELVSGENSAEALLEKIKAERAAAKPKRQTRKKAE